jgi:hypothetical protein
MLAIVLASAVPAQPVILDRAIVRGCSVIAKLGLSRPTSGPSMRT